MNRQSYLIPNPFCGMKWIGSVFIIVCVVLTYFCIMPVSAGARSDLVFDLGGGVEDMTNTVYNGIAVYSTTISSDPYSPGMSVWVTDESKSYGSVDFVFKSHLSNDKERYSLSSCSLGDECYYGKWSVIPEEPLIKFRVGNYLVQIKAIADKKSQINILSYGQKIADVLSGPSDNTDSFDDIWNEYFAADFSELKRLESFIDDKNKELKRAETQPSYEVDPQPVYPDGGYGEASLPSTQNIGQSYDVATINAEISRAQNTIDRINTNYNSYSKEEVSKYYSLSGDDRQKIRDDTERLISIYKKEIDDQNDIISEGEAELAAVLVGFDYDSDDGSGMRNLGEDANDPSSTTLMKSHYAGLKIDSAQKKIEKFEDKILKSQSIINNLELAEKLQSASS